MKLHHLILILLAASGTAAAQVPLEGTRVQDRSELPHALGFVSRGDSVQAVIASLGGQLNTPAIVSARAQKKTLKGSFDLSDPRKTLEFIAGELGLIWYTDSQSLYVYDAAEAENVVGHMTNASVATLNSFLVKAGLYDGRYPLRGGAGDGTFYLAGPPVYVQIVMNAARYLDTLYRDADRQAEHVEVIKLQHTFVNTRSIRQRDATVLVPGMAEVLMRVLAPAGWVQAEAPPAAADPVPAEAADTGLLAALTPKVAGATAPVAPTTSVAATSKATVLPYTEANSLIVRGTLAQIQVIRNVVAQLDVPRKQIELSVWIVDIKRNELEKLGVQWAGEVGIGRTFSAALNAGNLVSTIDGARFMTSVSALRQSGAASIVSRPILLTQENVPALFDSNSTLYTRLLAERTAAMEAITYGTTVSVLPRVSDTDDVELQINIEDGTAGAPEAGVDGIPIVGRTMINTVARVPRDLSLLVGGYTRQSEEVGKGHIPGLGKLPFVGGIFRHRNSRRDDVARLFLIQPRVIVDSALPNRHDAARIYTPALDTPLPLQLEHIRSPIASEAP